MQLLPFSVQFNRATKRPDFAKIEGSLALVNFIRNNLEVRSSIKNWNKLDTNELVTSAIALFNRQWFQRPRTWLYNKLYPPQRPGVLMQALLLSEAEYDVRVSKNTIQYYKNGQLVKEVTSGEPRSESEFE